MFTVYHLIYWLRPPSKEKLSVNFFETFYQINQIDLSKPCFLTYADELCQSFYTNLAWCGLIIHAGTLVFCVVWLIVNWPLIVFQKVNSSPHSAVPPQRWPCMPGRAEDSIYQHHTTYNRAVSCSSIRFNERPAQLSISHSGGRDAGWIRKMSSFWGSEMWKALYRKVCPLVLVCVCVLGKGGCSSDRSFSQIWICMVNKNRGGCLD